MVWGGHRSEYFVTVPLASITAWHEASTPRVGMALRPGVSAQFFLVWPCTALPSSSHSCSIGFRSGDWLRQLSQLSASYRKYIRCSYFGVRLRVFFFVTPRTAIITVGSLGLGSPVRVMTPGFELGLGLWSSNWLRTDWLQNFYLVSDNGLIATTVWLWQELYVDPQTLHLCISWINSSVVF